MWRSKWLPPHSVNTGVKKETRFPFINFLLYSNVQQASKKLLLFLGTSEQCRKFSVKHVHKAHITSSYCQVLMAGVRDRSQSRMEANSFDSLLERNGLPFEYWDQTVWPIIFYFELGLTERNIPSDGFSGLKSYPIIGLHFYRMRK